MDKYTVDYINDSIPKDKIRKLLEDKQSKIFNNHDEWADLLLSIEIKLLKQLLEEE